MAKRQLKKTNKGKKVMKTRKGENVKTSKAKLAPKAAKKKKSALSKKANEVKKIAQKPSKKVKQGSYKSVKKGSKSVKESVPKRALPKKGKSTDKVSMVIAEATKPKSALKPVSKPTVAKAKKTPKASATEIIIRAEIKNKPVHIRNEDYMNEIKQVYFREILLDWKKQLLNEMERTVHHMQDEAANFPDPNDRATQEEEFSLELRTRDRERKLVKKIDEALMRIDNHEYGYCEACGIEIGEPRLKARPTATLCIDCKTIDEIREKHFS